ncbi:serine protease [Pseudonocardia oroxyli]|uniref:Trypsin-like peptidase domain-containing protein n=1 Tax=Pseudonocardia oroxyli TaxID=366584 RepID=A0A1G7PG78_PSEOR|nr:serine protease [Pseudonocardia oroxyli]SDF85243.1 hypothetical protein SAMN05216377_107110 [Pseudonocardia oroxyli]
MRIRSRRGALAAAATVAALAAVVVVVPSTASARPAPAAVPAAAPAPVWAPRETAGVTPGVQTITQGGGSCTGNFVFRGDGGTLYLGQAAHCAGTGAETETDGCNSSTMPLGTPVTVRGAHGYTTTGRMVYSSWVTMQQRAETDPVVCGYNDFALVELPADTAATTNPTVPFFGGPTGVNTTGLPLGAQAFSYGNSPTRAGIAALTPKAGVSAGDVADGWQHQVYTVNPGIPGDSGSAFLDASGRALGLLSTLNLAPLPVSNGVTDLARSLAYANAHSGLGPVGLVDGTAPFTPTPPGVDPQEIAPPAGPPV